MKRNRGKAVLIWILSFAPVLLLAAVYAKLPAEVPIHWDFQGNVGYGAKSQLWLLVIGSPLTTALLWFLPHIDPKKDSYEKFSEPYELLMLAMPVFMWSITGVCLVEAFRPGTLAVSMVICAMCSLLYIVLGNMMPKFRPNFFCGIKTPWTLSSETVWTRTHRLGGRMMFASGIIGLLGAFIPNEVVRLTLLFAPLMLACFVPMLYSYIWYQQEQKTKQ